MVGMDKKAGVPELLTGQRRGQKFVQTVATWDPLCWDTLGW